jgi:alginate O-acetyltransferase complex protein AlgI
MVFSSPLFLFLFLPATLAAYFLAPRALRNAVLLAASLLFYAWGEPVLVLVMLASIGVNYVLALAVERAAGRAAQRPLLALAVAANLAVLGHFKYAGFLTEQLNGLLSLAQLPALPVPDVRMPIGISFFTFQALSYVLDVGRGEVRAARNPLQVALYVALFPQLIAGPIVRYVDVAAMIRARQVTLDGFAAGVQRFVVGLGKKVLIANAAAAVADAAFDLPDAELTMAVAWLGLAAYTLQIYFDFSGYSDMAIGLGRMFGFEFKENFQHPYVAASMTDFWRRWHISLSTWFRDYLYIPLGGSHGPAWKTYRNLLVVFLLCGFWHGASWNFLLWGLLHGGFLILERQGGGALLARLPRFAAHGYTLLAVMAGWVLFRAVSLEHAWGYSAALVGFGAAHAAQPLAMWVDSGTLLALVAGCVGSTPWIPASTAWLESRGRSLSAARELAVAAATLAVLVASAAVLVGGTYNPFIYFRF